MSSEDVMCEGCNRLVESSSKFCPHCGISLGVLEERIKFDRPRELKENIEENVLVYKEEVRQPKRIRSIFDSRYPEILEIQRKLTNDVLKQFPDLKKRIDDEPETIFKIFVIEVPYESNDGRMLHDCLLQKLSLETSGLINLSCDAQEITSELYSIDVPIWAPIQIGEQLLEYQRNVITAHLPEPQKKFMYSAEPWAVCTRVYNIEGRWIVWRVINELKDLNKFIKETRTIPVNFHFFADLRYSNLFPVLATREEGELIVGIFDENEEGKFLERLKNLNSSYSLNSRIIPKTISISKEILEDFGILQHSASKFLQSQFGHLHTSTISKGIFGQLQSDLAAITKKTTVQPKMEKDQFRECLVEGILGFSKGETDSILRILRPLSREQRQKYKIYGGSL